MEPEASTAQVPIMEDSHNFFKISQTRGFVDKSLLIETAFKHGSRMVITAPSKFCKSTNLHMLKCFLSDSSDRAKCKVFQTLDIYKHSKQFYKQHFHKYKVVFVDLTSGKSASYSDALDAYRWAIHNTFLEHDYLLGTSVLKSSEEKIFSSWCDMNRGYKTKQKEDMVNDLSLLVEVLARYGGNKVIVLVDEYDSIINKEMYEGQRGIEFFDIYNLTSDVIRSLVKDNNKVKIAVVSGISSIPAKSLYKLDNLVCYRFLGNHEFCKYYGLLQNELHILLEKQVFNKHLPKEDILRGWFGGYLSVQNVLVVNLFSLLRYLKCDEYCFRLKIDYHAEMFINLSNSPLIARLIHQFMLCKGPVDFEVSDRRHLKQLLDIRWLFSRNSKYIVDTSILGDHLHEIGLTTLYYCNYTFPWLNCPQNTRRGVRLPNTEIYLTLSHLFQWYAIQNCNIPTHYYDQRKYELFVKKCKDHGMWNWNDLFTDAY